MCDFSELRTGARLVDKPEWYFDMKRLFAAEGVSKSSRIYSMCLSVDFQPKIRFRDSMCCTIGRDFGALIRPAFLAKFHDVAAMAAPKISTHKNRTGRLFFMCCGPAENLKRI